VIAAGPGSLPWNSAVLRADTCHSGGMRILFTAAPAYGLMLPAVPLIWAARSAGHEVVLATTSDVAQVGADAGLPVVDVYPDHAELNEFMRATMRPDTGTVGIPGDGERSELIRRAASLGHPFGMFTLLMTEGTVAAGRDFAPDLVVYSSDHKAGRLATRALGVPGLEVGNRVSWSVRDAWYQDLPENPVEAEIERALRDDLAIPDGEPDLIARIDPRAPSMGGLDAEVPDVRDGVPWWSMRFVPYNGGGVFPEWLRRAPGKPRIGVTLGTVVPGMKGVGSLAVTVEALGEMDVDVVLAAGQADLSALGPLPANVRSAGYLPLTALLPSCSLLVHHGGSGTTAAALHHGVPQLIFPAFADNPMSAERVVQRGVGLSHDPSTVDAAAVRELAERLLGEEAFASAARSVSAEMAGQPSPAAIIERLSSSAAAT